MSSAVIYDPKQIASTYSNSIVGTGYLAYRDLDGLIDKHVIGHSALDYGCGRGRSSRFLSELGFKVDAVDICPHMLSEAAKQDSSINYHLLEPFNLKVLKKQFNLILSQLVLVEIHNKQQLKQMLAEQFNALALDGVLIHTTASNHLLKHQWLSIYTNYNQNKTIKNGQAGRVKLLNRQLELTSWHWDESYLLQAFSDAGFDILEVHKPLGCNEDPYHWQSEKTYSPYNLFVLKKSNS